ncbi:hypothetical protein Tco_1530690 [Tanacetum coccineum]
MNSKSLKTEKARKKEEETKRRVETLWREAQHSELAMREAEAVSTKFMSGLARCLVLGFPSILVALIVAGVSPLSGKVPRKEKSSSSSAAAEVVDDVKDKVYRLFGRQRPVHKVLGGDKLMVRLNSFARLISDAERQRVNQEKELKYARFILTGNLCFKGTKQVVHGDHRRGCSDSTLLRPHTNIEHIQLIDVEVQDAAAELDRLATISKDMELITRNRIRPFYYVVHTGLCEPAVGLMVVSDNVPTENESTSNIVAGSISEEKGGVYVHRTTGLGWPPAVAVVGRKDPTS